MILFPGGLFRTGGYPGWNPLDRTSANVSLSNSSMTAAATANANFGEATRGTVAKSSGKLYCEFTLGSATGSGITTGCGLATLTTALANGVAGGSGALLAYASATIWAPAYGGAVINNSNGSVAAINVNGSAYGATSTQLASGNVIGVAVDFTAKRIWFKNWSKSSTAGQWNMALNGDPAAGTNGLDISGLSSLTLYPVIWAARGVTGTMGAFNGGQTAFTGTVPTGYTGAWK